MPRAASSTLRFVPLLLASIAFSSPAWAACAPDAGQQQQYAMAPAQAQEAAPSPEPTAAQASDADADNEARAALAAIGRLDDADTALALAADGAAPVSYTHLTLPTNRIV